MMSSLCRRAAGDNACVTDVTHGVSHGQAALDGLDPVGEMAEVCAHLDQIEIAPPAEVAGCEDCLKSGDRWLHLRVCLTCGYVGCCDSSPNKHASKHAGAIGHPIIRSAEPGETWCWCYEDEVAFEIEFD